MAPKKIQGRYYMLTIPVNAWKPELPEGCHYVKGQEEIGTETGYHHWQSKKYI